jgi:hypothetical protein
MMETDTADRWTDAYGTSCTNPEMCWECDGSGIIYRETCPTCGGEPIPGSADDGEMGVLAGGNSVASEYLTNSQFVGYAARLAQKSAAWAADTAQSFFIDAPNAAIDREPAIRFLAEIRRLLDHMEDQVQP